MPDGADTILPNFPLPDNPGAVAAVETLMLRHCRTQLMVARKLVSSLPENPRPILKQTSFQEPSRALVDVMVIGGSEMTADEIEGLLQDQNEVINEKDSVIDSLRVELNELYATADNWK